MSDYQAESNTVEPLKSKLLTTIIFSAGHLRELIL